MITFVVGRFLLGVITLAGRLGFNKDRPIVSLYYMESPNDTLQRFDHCSGVAQGGKLRHGQRCSPKCRLGHAPQPPSLTCDNGVIGSFECPEYIDPLQLACKEKCSAEGKHYCTSTKWREVSLPVNVSLARSRTRDVKDCWRGEVIDGSLRSQTSHNMDR